MRAGKLNLYIEQHAKFTKSFVWRDARKRPINLIGYTALLQIRDAIGGTVLLELSTANGRITLGGTAGTVTLFASDEVTKLIDWTAGVYDLLMTPPDGEAVRLLEGRVTTSLSVTRPA